MDDFNDDGEGIERDKLNCKWNNLRFKHSALGKPGSYGGFFPMQTAINCVFVVYQMMEYTTSLRMVDFEREKQTSHSWSKSKSAFNTSVPDKLKSGQNSCLAELYFIEIHWKCSYQSLLKHLYLLYCTGKIQMTMTSKKEIAKCQGKSKLSIFSTGNFKLYCMVITQVVSSVGGTAITMTPFVEQLFEIELGKFISFLRLFAFCWRFVLFYQRVFDRKRFTKVAILAQ